MEGSSAASRPLKVCFFNRSYYPDVAATGQLLTELAQDLVRKHGCEVSVVAGPSTDTQSESTSRGRYAIESHEGVKIFRARGTTFGRGHFAGRFANYLTYFFSACVAGLRVPRPDVVVALTDPPIVGLAGWLAARRAGGEFVFLCQDVFPEVANLLEDFHSRAINGVLQSVNRFLIRRANKVIVLGETMKRRLVEGKGAEFTKVDVIHNWADTEVIVPGAKENAFREKHALSGRFVVMHSGNMGLSQNLETLLEAARLLKALPDVTFVLVGDGVRRQELQKKARSLELGNVHFLPYEPKENLVSSFAAADVFVVSLKDGLAGYIVPSKLYGILAAGRPFVAAVEEECEVAQIAREYDCGVVARPGDPEDLAQKILALYRDRKQMKRMGGNARRAALRFDRKKQVSAYYELLSAVAAPKVKKTPFLKRAFDVKLSGLGLIGSSPLWLLIACAIKLEDGGPVFFEQERVGQGGRRFRSLKFRSMVPDADKKFGTVQAEENDPRVTKVGRILRATAMDELPQLWNIFQGDMSFVGPRALAASEAEINGNGDEVELSEIPGYWERHRVVPGLTGIAQIFAPRDIPRRQKFRYDRLYVQKQSFWLDLRLIAVSFWITFRGKWEVRDAKF